MIRKAIIPAAGFGTRFLPATKAVPKEMIPVVDTPTIEYVVREAVESGIDDILIVVSRGKRSIEEHFSSNLELETALESRNKIDELETIRAFSGVKLHYAWQHEQRGLGHAILHGRNHIADEPFAVLLGDTIMESYSSRPVIGQLIDTYVKHESAVVALQQVSPDRVSSYGIVSGESAGTNDVDISGFVEKPAPEEAPSNLAIASSYVLTPEIFGLIEALPAGKNGEIGLTEALLQLLSLQKVYGRIIDGMRHDIGNKLEFIKANVLLGLQRSDIGSDLAEWLKGITHR